MADKPERWHVNPITGEVGRCEAQIRCAFATVDNPEPPHFSTRDEALQSRYSLEDALKGVGRDPRRPPIVCSSETTVPHFGSIEEARGAFLKSHPEPVFTPELVTAPVKASDLHAGLVVQNPDTDEPDMVVARRYETDTNTVEVTFLSDGRSVRGSADQVFEPASVKSLEGTLFRVPAPNGLGDRSAHNSAESPGARLGSPREAPAPAVVLDCPSRPRPQRRLGVAPGMNCQGPRWKIVDLGQGPAQRPGVRPSCAGGHP